jgi:hypothetical protein
MIGQRTFRAVGALAAGFLAASALTELAFQVVMATPLRWVLPAPQVALYGPDPGSGYRHRTNVSGLWLTEHRAFIRTSNLGLRDRDRNVTHDHGPRAIVIGDSFTEALQVDWSQTAVAVAERMLARDMPDAEVVNLGLAGAGPAVHVARLQSPGLTLTPDAAVIVLSVDQLLSKSVTDDSDFAGYRLAADGEFHLSHGFRSGRGYRFRTSLGGQVFYWLLDHSQIVRLINDRKNVGLLAEWRQPPGSGNRESSSHCRDDTFEEQLALWVGGNPAVARGVLRAFIRDLAAIGYSNRLPITIAIRGIEARCPDLEVKRAELVEAMRAKLEAAGLGFVDLDARVVAKVGRDGVAPLHGFGAALGSGHLNVRGNRVYGEILAEILAPQLSRFRLRNGGG